MKKLFSLHFIVVVLLLVFALWAGKGIFTYPVFQTHDLKHHLARGFDAVFTLREGHFPLRWSGLLNFECGLPLFTFYYPLLYYLMAVITPLTGSLILSLKLINFCSLLLGTLFFYLWLKEETKDALASFAAAMLYLFAPYRFSLIFVRGSPEYLSYAIFPVVLYLYAKAFNAKTSNHLLKFAFLAALVGGLFAFSHNIAVMVLMPIALVYLVIKFITLKHLALRRYWSIIFAYISTFGLGAFFIIPALLEAKFTKLSIPIFNYAHHFPEPWQVVNSKWGYGDSAIGTADDAMSFQLGYAHWAVLGLVAMGLSYLLIKLIVQKRGLTDFLVKNIWILLFFTLSLAFLFLVLPWSMPVWDGLPILQTIQFSWRLLGVVVLTSSALGAFWLAAIKKTFLYWPLVIGLVGLAVIGNRNHLLSQPVLEADMPLYQTYDKLELKRRAMTGYAETVLPPSATQSCYYTTPVVTTTWQEKLTFEELNRGSTYGSVVINQAASTIKGDKVILNLSYFPHQYSMEVNGGRIAYEDCGGRVCVPADSLTKNSNSVSWHVIQTPIQKSSNTISVIFLVSWLGILLYYRKNGSIN